jgi:hypothetical protein
LAAEDAEKGAEIAEKGKSIGRIELLHFRNALL